MDEILRRFHLLALASIGYFRIYQSVVLLQFPFGNVFTLAAHTLNATLAVYGANLGKPRLYWLHSLVLVIISGFGGGLVAPVLLGKPSALLTTDLIVPMCIFFWYIIHYLGTAPFFNWFPVKFVWTILVALFRTHSAANMVTLANSVLNPGPFYPIPLVGPILAGTIMGCAGTFFPLDKGLAPIMKSTPWPIQGAFMSSFFYHVMVNDANGPVGNCLRSIVGSYSKNSTITIIATVQITLLLSQLIFSPKSNFFTPFHKFLYLVFQVEGPKDAVPDSEKVPNLATVGWDYQTRLQLERALEALRVVLVFGVIAAHIYFSIPPTCIYASNFSMAHLNTALSVAPGAPIIPEPALQMMHKVMDVAKPEQALVPSRYTSLRPNDAIGSCQFFGKFQKCTPHVLRFEHVKDDYTGSAGSLRLATYTNKNKDEPVWSKELLRVDGKMRVESSGVSTTEAIDLINDGKIALIVGNQGEIQIKLVKDGGLPLEGDLLVWSSSRVTPPPCKDPPVDGGVGQQRLWDVPVPSLSLNPLNGTPVIQCPSGEVVLLDAAAA